MSLLSVSARIADQIAEQNPGNLPAPAPPMVSQQQQEGQQEQVSYIKHEKGKGYCVKSEKNSDWSGGCYPSEGEAKKRLNQVEMFKHMKKGTVTPEDISYDLHLVAARLAHSQEPLHVVLSDLQSILSAMDTAVSPPGWGGPVEHMEKDPDIKSPEALAWYMKNKGDKPHAKPKRKHEGDK